MPDLPLIGLSADSRFNIAVAGAIKMGCVLLHLRLDRRLRFGGEAFLWSWTRWSAETFADVRGESEVETVCRSGARQPFDK
jgi:hypothetical protein